MINFTHFFVPYIQFLRGAAYNIAQIIEGLSPTTLTFVIGGADSRLELGYAVPIAFIAGMLLLYSFLLVGLIVVAAYVLGRWRGAFVALLLLILPGVASVFSFWPNINYSPETIVLGGHGTLGNPLGMFPLVLMGLLTGWSLVVILSDLIGLKDKFRHYYDHVWYALAILTGIFFVMDSNIADVVRELQETHQESRQASAYLLQQVRTYDLQCQQTRRGRRRSGPQPLPSKGTVSCAWASEVQELLINYTTSHIRLFQTFGPKSGSDVYSPPTRIGRELSPEQILTLRREIQAYNNSQCPIEARGEGWIKYAQPLGTCQRPPSPFCTAFPEPLDGHVDHSVTSRTVAIASECIIPSLIASRARQEKLQAVVEDKTRTKYIRWLVFILLSLVVGGKVANATSRVIELDKRPEQEKRRVLKLLRPVWLGPKNVAGLAIKVCRAGLGYAFIGLYRIVRAILPGWSG
jgi:hypothetical protein